MVLAQLGKGSVCLFGKCEMEWLPIDGIIALPRSCSGVGASQLVQAWERYGSIGSSFQLLAILLTFWSDALAFWSSDLYPEKGQYIWPELLVRFLTVESCYLGSHPFLFLGLLTKTECVVHALLDERH